MNRTSLTNSRNALTLLINQKREAGVLRNVTANNLLSRVPTMHKRTADSLIDTLSRSTGKTTLAKLKKGVITQPVIRQRQPEETEAYFSTKSDDRILNTLNSDTYKFYVVCQNFYRRYFPDSDQDVIVTVFGTDRIVSYDRFGNPNTEYAPDYTFTNVYGSDVVNMTRITKTELFKFGVLDKISQIMGSSNANVVGSIKLTQRIEPEFVDQIIQYADANTNCFFNTIRRSLENAKSTRLIKELTPVINRLEEHYITSATGVPMTKDFKDIKHIVKSLYAIDITITNKLGDTIFTSHTLGNKKHHVRMTLERLNHVVDFEDFNNKQSDKPIVYVEDINKAFQEHHNMVMFSTYTKDNLIKAFWDNTTMYKRAETKDYDDGLYNINSLDDKAYMKFIEMNKISGELSKKHHPDLYKFVNSSVYNVCEIYFTHTSNRNIDQSKTFCYDMNKAYGSHTTSIYYPKHKFPASPKFNFYNVVQQLTADEIQILLTKTGFVQITNINIPIVSVNKLRYFKNNYIYPMPVIQWLVDNNCTFEIKRVAFNIWKQDINFTDDMINNKQYSKIVGKLHITNENREYHIKCTDFNEARFLKNISGNKVKSFSDTKGFLSSVTIVEPKSFVSNYAHIASYFLAYSLLSVLDKVKLIPFTDLFGVRVDCIKTYKDYSHIFPISKNLGEWKIEAPKEGLKTVEYLVSFIESPYDSVYTVENNLTIEKLNLNRINLVQGMAGSGKTTHFLSSNFGNKLYNILATFPNNELTMKFKNEAKEDMKNITTSTYHKAFNIETFGKVDKYRESPLGTYYNYVLIDESTMLSIQHFEKIVAYALANYIILLIVGDYDLKTKTIYQMPPVNAVSFLNFKFDMEHTFIIYKKENYRQKNDFKFRLFANECRGKTNDDILRLITKNKIFDDKYVSYDSMVENFNPDKDIILSSYRKGGSDVSARTDSINFTLFNKLDVVNAKYHTTGNGHAKNESIKLTKDTFDAKKYDLAYAITSHLCQGCEYDEDKTIYIMLTKYFEENQLYVLLTRAKTSKQIRFVIPN